MTLTYWLGTIELTNSLPRILLDKLFLLRTEHFDSKQQHFCQERRLEVFKNKFLKPNFEIRLIEEKRETARISNSGLSISGIYF